MGCSASSILHSVASYKSNSVNYGYHEFNQRFPISLQDRSCTFQDGLAPDVYNDYLRLFKEIWNSTFGWHLDLGHMIYKEFMNTSDEGKQLIRKAIDSNPTLKTEEAMILSLSTMLVKSFHYITVMSGDPSVLHNHFMELGRRHLLLSIRPKLIVLFGKAMGISFVNVHQKYRSGLTLEEMYAFRCIIYLMVNSVLEGYFTVNCSTDYIVYIGYHLYKAQSEEELKAMKTHSEYFLTLVNAEPKAFSSLVTNCRSILFSEKEQEYAQKIVCIFFGLIQRELNLQSCNTVCEDYITITEIFQNTKDAWQILQCCRHILKLCEESYPKAFTKYCKHFFLLTLTKHLHETLLDFVLMEGCSQIYQALNYEDSMAEENF